MYVKVSQNIPKCLNMSNGQKCLKNNKNPVQTSLKTSKNVKKMSKKYPEILKTKICLRNIWMPLLVNLVLKLLDMKPHKFRVIKFIII